MWIAVAGGGDGAVLQKGKNILHDLTHVTTLRSSARSTTWSSSANRHVVLVLDGQPDVMAAFRENVCTFVIDDGVLDEEMRLKINEMLDKMPSPRYDCCITRGAAAVVERGSRW